MPMPHAVAQRACITTHFVGEHHRKILRSLINLDSSTMSLHRGWLPVRPDLRGGWQRGLGRRSAPNETAGHGAWSKKS